MIPNHQGKRNDSGVARPGGLLACRRPVNFQPGGRKLSSRRIYARYMCTRASVACACVYVCVYDVCVCVCVRVVSILRYTSILGSLLAGIREVVYDDGAEGIARIGVSWRDRLTRAITRCLDL